MVWKYVNKTTGASIECNDLNFLLNELIEVRGLPLPNDFGINLMLHGNAECSILSNEGLQEICLGHRSLVRGQTMYMANPVFI